MFEDDRLGRIENALQQLLDRAVVKSHYTVEEFARMTGARPLLCGNGQSGENHGGEIADAVPVHAHNGASAMRNT